MDDRFLMETVAMAGKIMLASGAEVYRVEETMKYMALGIYNKSGFENSSYTKNNPLWLETSVNDKYIGRLPKAMDLATPNTARLSFVSKHGNKFIGGRTKGKFNLVLEFR